MIFYQPSIDPVVVSLFFFDIRWYSLAYVFSFIIGSILIKNLNRKYLSFLSEKQIDKFFLWAIIGIIFGGRIGYVLFYQFNYFILDPLYIFKIWTGGMSFHGGLFGIIISMYFFCKKNNLKFFYLADLVSIVSPIGLFFGRIANFINTELYGRITDFPFAIIYTKIDMQPRHPSQLYEALFEGIIIFIIINFFYKNKYYIKINIFSVFLILYSSARFLLEFFREPDQHLGFILGNLTMGQLLSIPMFLVGILLLTYGKTSKNKRYY